jgi:hypothetical protein
MVGGIVSDLLHRAQKEALFIRTNHYHPAFQHWPTPTFADARKGNSLASIRGLSSMTPMKGLPPNRCMFYRPCRTVRVTTICAILFFIRSATCLLALLMSACVDTSKRDAEDQVKVSIEALKTALKEQSDSIADLKKQIASLGAAVQTQPPPSPAPTNAMSDELFQKAVAQFQESLRRKMDAGVTAVVVAPVQMAHVIIQGKSRPGQSEVVQVAFSKDAGGNWKPVQSLDIIVLALKGGPGQGPDEKRETPQSNRNQSTGDQIYGEWKEIEPGIKKWMPASSESKSPSGSVSHTPASDTSTVSSAPGPAPSSTRAASGSPMFKKVVPSSDPAQVKVPTSSSSGTVSGHWKETEPGKKTWVPTSP